MNPPGYFTASYDRVTKILSTVVCLGLLAAGVASHNLFVAIVAFLSMLLGYAYSPRGYAIWDGAITIRRVIGNVRFPLDTVREARLATRDDFRGCVRLWGSGGLFGYYGLFRTSTLGRSTWYMTRRKPAVIVVSRDDAGGRDKTILLSPDDIDGFLSALRSVSRAAIGNSGSAVPYESAQPRGPLTAAILIGVGLGVGGMLLAIGAIKYNPGPASYTLTTESLVIHDRFYPVTLGARSVDVPAVRVVDLAQESGWISRLRVGGFTNSHYQSGWFLARNGTKMRLYRAASRRLVLLPPSGDGNPVLLEVADPDGFVDQLRATWR